MTIKAIIWDNGGVLGHVTGGSFPHLLAERLGVPVEDVIRELTGPESRLLDLGEISKDEYFDYVIKDLGLPPDKKAALEMKEGDLYYDKELLNYIYRQKDSFITALLSIMPLHIQELIRGTSPELEAAFDHVIVSSEVNMVKPDPEIYRLTLYRIGCEPHEAVFIDDKQENVKAAEKLGIHGIVFHNRDQVIKELETILSADP
jgi:putative hydrolase of the HAD superfamily